MIAKWHTTDARMCRDQERQRGIIVRCIWEERRSKTTEIAIWIIAIVEVIRAIQNHIQLLVLKRDTSARDNAYAEFVKSLKATDKERVKRLLEEFEKEAPTVIEAEEEMHTK